MKYSGRQKVYDNNATQCLYDIASIRKYQSHGVVLLIEEVDSSWDVCID